MAETPSTMLPLGTRLPEFRLPDLDGTMVASSDLRGALAQMARDCQPSGLSVVAINANDTVQCPQDDQQGMRAEARADGYTFPWKR